MCSQAVESVVHGLGAGVASLGLDEGLAPQPALRGFRAGNSNLSLTLDAVILL